MRAYSFFELSFTEVVSEATRFEAASQEGSIEKNIGMKFTEMRKFPLSTIICNGFS